MENKFEMVAKTFQGLEDVLRDELITLGAENVEIGNRMVTFEGDNEILYRANMCCRTALRILKPIIKFTADDPDELYDKVRELPWEQFMGTDSTFSIDSTVNGEEFTHSKFVTYRVKDGIADHFNDLFGSRPSIRLQGADLILNVHVAGNRVTISLDSSGEPLFKRGYRVEQTEAPINEVLAAGIILKTGWRGDCDFADPMCGSGTFLVEAALIAANINPGIYRESFAFEKWKDFDADLFEEIYNDDSGEREFRYKIYGGDIDPEAVKIARRNIKSAKVEDMVEIACKPFADWNDNSQEGVLVTNPPYGERLKPDNLSLLYKGIGSTLKNYFKGWHAWIIGYKEEQFDDIGLKPSIKIPLHNGSLECSLREYVLFDGRYSEFRAEGGSVANKSASQTGPKKVRHISDDEWVKESNKFNKGSRLSPSAKGHRHDSDSRHSKGKDSRNTRKKDNAFIEFSDEVFIPTRERAPKDNRNRNRDNKDRSFSGKPKENNFRSKPNRDDSRFKDEKRNFKDDKRGREEKSFRDKETGPKTNKMKIVTPKGPKIPESQERTVNPVHFRQRKNRRDIEETD